jgi:predicted NBD/HSP70 family sugar kinase
LLFFKKSLNFNSILRVFPRSPTLMSAKKLLFKRKIMREIYISNTLSLSEISWRIKKSLPLTTRLINELIEEGYVSETGFAPSTGGRRPAMYSLKPDVLYIVSVALDQFVARIAVMDLHNNVVSEIEKFELPLSKNPQALAVLTDKIAHVIRRSGIPKDKIAGIGIGMPGFVDVKKSINHTFLKAEKGSITEYITSKTGIPSYIDNDSSLIALAELRFGGAQGKKNAMVINIGWGVGLGMILNGELFRGQNGFAGEFSHIPLFTNGKLCSCGKSGCLETETSLLVIIEKAKQGLLAGKLSRLKLSEPEHDHEDASDAIIMSVSEGDRFAVELFSEAGYNIGRGVAILIHLLNPEMIILSGRGSTAGKIWKAPIQQALNEHCIPKLADNTVVEISTLGYQAELIGAAVLVMDNYEKEAMKKGIAEKSELQ